MRKHTPKQKITYKKGGAAPQKKHKHKKRQRAQTGNETHCFYRQSTTKKYQEKPTTTKKT